MATAAVDCVTVEPSERECSICGEEFKVPKLLPCGHLLCRHCVLSWLHKQPNAGCPLCRHPIVQDQQMASGDGSLQKIADSLPTDLAMQELVKVEKILTQHHQCQVCDDVKATAICLHCGDFFCQACTNVHRKSSSTKHHVLEELATLLPDKLSARRLEEPCSVHADKSSEVFCPSHGTTICLLCATTDHRDCRSVTSLENKMTEARRVLQELADTLREGEARLERGLNELDQHMDQVEKKTKGALAEIEDACNRLESAVKACRRRLKELTQAKVQ